MEQVSLKAIIYDLLDIIRGAQVADDEPISERQIETWIHQYRAILLKRDIDKGHMPNPDYIQNIDDISLELDAVTSRYRTDIDIPKGIDFKHNYGLTFVGDALGDQIQILPEKRVNGQQYARWTTNDTLAYINSSRVYLYNEGTLTSVYIRGIFENPVEAAESNGITYNYDSVYPVPMSLIPIIKEEILKKELNIEWQAPSDNTNNADHGLSQH